MHRKNQNAWLLAMIFAIALVTGPFAIPTVMAQKGKTSEQLRQNKKKLEQEIRYTNELLQRTQKSKQINLGKIKILREQIRMREKLIKTINQELKEMEVQLIYESQQVERLSNKIRTLKSEYARLISHAYRTMNGRSKMAFIFSARDFNQAYLRLKYYQQYAAYRREQAAKIMVAQKQLISHTQLLDSIRIEKLGLVDNQTREKQKLDKERQAKDNAVKEYSTKEKQLLATLKTKQQAAAKLNSEIEKAINAEIRASEARARAKEKKEAGKSTTAAKTKAPTSSGLDLTPQEVKLSSSFSANIGKLPWPCDKGFISEAYGEHFHPVLKHVKVKNNGVDIMTESGAQVKSVFGGKVTKVMSFQQLNKVVIIRHGEYLTVYSNLGEVHVREGQEVTARQVIGTVHAEDGEQRAEIHFELWKGKTILNPELWLAKK